MPAAIFQELFHVLSMLFQETFKEVSGIIYPIAGGRPGIKHFKVQTK
jgi:hypothetical protein